MIQSVTKTVGLARLRRTTGFVVSFLGVGVVAAACTWLAFVGLPSLSSLLASFVGFGGVGSSVSYAAVVLLLAVALAGGGVLCDRLLGGEGVGVGAFVAGAGALLFTLLPGAFTTVVFAFCAAAGVGVLLPGVVRLAWLRGGRSRVGTALGLVFVGYLLTNAFVLYVWYGTSWWLGLVATSHLLADGVVGVTPRTLVYATLGSWRLALLVVAGGLLAFAVARLLWVETSSVAELREGVPGLRADDIFSFSIEKVRDATPTVLLAVLVAWTAAASVVVHDQVTAAITAPLVALAGKLLVFPLVIGALIVGPVFDRFGPRPATAAGFVGGAAGPLLYASVSGPATTSVGAAPPGTPLLVVAILLTGISVGALVVLLFSLPLMLPSASPDSVGTAAGYVLAAALAAALVGRAATSAVSVPSGGDVSVSGVALLAVPALFGLVTLVWHSSRPDEPETKSKKSESESEPP